MGGRARQDPRHHGRQGRTPSSSSGSGGGSSRRSATATPTSRGITATWTPWHWSWCAKPERFQVIVTTNLYGDILSDLGAGLIGGLGIAASANLHPGRPGLYEPVHGSAPPLVGKGVANPMATVLTGALMLEQLGCAAGAMKLERAVERVVASGPLTPDLGARGSTAEVARALSGAMD